MKVRTYSWVLAGAYLVCGVILFLVIPKFQEIYSGFNIEGSFLMRATLATGPVGCLCSSAAVAMFVVLKDVRFRSRLLNPIFTVVFGLWIICTPFALIYPLITAGEIR